MAYIAQEKNKLLNRVHRIRGQAEVIERSLDQEWECSGVLNDTCCITSPPAGELWTR